MVMEELERVWIAVAVDLGSGAPPARTWMVGEAPNQIAGD